MRKIEFRGKRIDDNEWLHGFYDGCYEGATINYLKDGIAWNCKVHTETIGQYIGIKDIHQKKIFEGDIIQFVWDSDSCWGKAGTYKGYIRFNEGIFEVVYIGREKKTKDSDGYWHVNSESDDVQSLFSWSEEIEVIGNIYENPEMRATE